MPLQYAGEYRMAHDLRGVPLRVMIEWAWGIIYRKPGGQMLGVLLVKDLFRSSTGLIDGCSPVLV